MGRTFTNSDWRDLTVPKKSAKTEKKGATIEISYVATELASLCAQRKMPQAWEFIIQSLPIYLHDKIFINAVVKFLQANKRTYPRKGDVVEKRKAGQPKKEAINDWDKIGARYEAMKGREKNIVRKLTAEFKRSDTTINRALKVYRNAKYPDDLKILKPK